LLHLITRSDTHTLGRTPLDERWARRKGFYLYNTQKSQETFILDGIRNRNPSERPQTYALDQMAIVYFMIHNIRFIVVFVI